MTSTRGKTFNYEKFIKAHPANAILGAGNDEQEIRDNSFRFANQVAKDLVAQGRDVGIYVKESGSNSFGYASDILIINSGNDMGLHDIVTASDTPSAASGFGEAQEYDAERVVAPLPEVPGGIEVPSVPAPGTPGPTPTPIPPTPTPIPPTPQPVPGAATYQAWVNGPSIDGDPQSEIHRLVRAYEQRNGHGLGATDFAHLAWGRLVEHQSVEQLIHNINNG